MIEVENGKNVNISLSNGQFVGGIIEKWSVEIIILKQVAGDGIIMIMQPDRDIVCVHILENKKENISQVQRDWEQLVETPPSIDKTKKLAELKILMTKTEKEIIAAKLKTHSISDVRTVNYGTPQFLKKPSS